MVALTPDFIRTDLKCGRGAISPGEKCTKGPATKTISKKKVKQGTFAEKGLVTLGAAATVGGLVFARSKRNSSKSIQRETAANAVAIAGGGLGLIGVGLGIYGERTKNQGARDLGAGVALAGGMFASAGRSSAKAEQAHRSRMKAFENINFESPNWTPPNSESFNYSYNRSSNRQASRGASSSQQSRQQQNDYRRQRWQEWTNSQRSSRTNQSTRGSNKAVPNPYQSLGISETATDKDIKKKWLELMRASHPDAGGDPESAKIYNAAYQEILRRRGRRDALWAEGFNVDWDGLAASRRGSSRRGKACGRGFTSSQNKCQQAPRSGPRNYAAEMQEQRNIMNANDFNSWRKANKLRMPTTQGSFDRQFKQYGASKQGAAINAAWKRHKELEQERNRRNAGYAFLGGAAVGLTALALSGRRR